MPRRARKYATAAPTTPAPHTITRPGVPATTRLLRHQILEPGHHLVRQKLHRVAPRLGIVRVIEAEQQQRAEAADLLVDRVQPIGDRVWRAHEPVVAGA